MVNLRSGEWVQQKYVIWHPADENTKFILQLLVCFDEIVWFRTMKVVIFFGENQGYSAKNATVTYSETDDLMVWYVLQTFIIIGRSCLSIDCI